MMARPDLAAVIARLRTEGSFTPSVEVKSAAGGLPSDVERTICAFANLPGGGIIILGIDERAGFRPVKLANPNLLKSALASKARQAIVPPATVEIYEDVFEGERLVVGIVAEAPIALKPYTLKRDGGSYLRFWDGDYRLADLEVQAFIAARQTPRFDIEPVPGATFGDLDNDLVTDFIVTVRTSDERLSDSSNDEVLRRMGVVTTDGEVTMAGLLALGSYPQQFFPNFCIQAAASPEPGAPTDVRVGDTARFSGPLAVMIDSAIAWTRRHSRHRIVDRPNGRVIDQFDFPPDAVRELVANSLVHRDLAPWSWSRAVELRIDATQLRLYNPGGLYGIDVERLGKTPVSSARNLQLLRVCQFTRTSDGRTVEALATGIPRVLAATEGEGLPSPTFFDQALTFTAVLHRPPSVGVDSQGAAGSSRTTLERIPAALQAVLDELESGPKSRAELANALGTEAQATRRRLSRLRALGLIEIDGRQGSHESRYRRIDQ